MDKPKRRGSRKATETITITVSKEFADNAREANYLLADEKENIGKTIESCCGWNFAEMLGRGVYKESGPAPEIAIEQHTWDSEAACRTAAKRLVTKVPRSIVLNPVPATKGRWKLDMSYREEKTKRETDIEHSYGWHAVMSIRNRLFSSKKAAVATIRNFETEWHPYEKGWIISGPGSDGMFRVHQGSVEIEDIAEVVSNDCIAIYRRGELVELED